MSFQIGPYTIHSRLLLAPMAGITDKPYRDICRRYGAGLVSSEMITSDLAMLNTQKTQSRLIQADEPEPRSVQIVGTDPQKMAEAARYNVEIGANIIDINMGCPAKKVCNKLAGSALMQDEKLVEKILKSVVQAIDIPVTLKTRTGWNYKNRNAINIAKIAEDCGISCITIHGRTRNQAYTGFAEHETIRQIKKAIKIPVIANGDIKDASDARFILDYTHVDGLMLGRITRGQPWIFKQINDELSDNKPPDPIGNQEKKNLIITHIQDINKILHKEENTPFIPKSQRVRQMKIARKYIGWYLYSLMDQDDNLLKKYRREIFSIDDAELQIIKLEEILNRLL